MKTQALQAIFRTSTRWATAGVWAVLCTACVTMDEGYGGGYGGGYGRNYGYPSTPIYGAQPVYPSYGYDRGDWAARERERERMQREREYNQQMRERDRQARERDQWQRQQQRDREQQNRDQQRMQEQQRREWERQQSQNRRDQEQMRRDQGRNVPGQEWKRQWRVSPNKQADGD